MVKGSPKETTNVQEKGSNPEEVKSEGVATSERKDAELVFETGPRSIRPVGLPGWLTVEMVRVVVICDLTINLAYLQL